MLVSNFQVALSKVCHHSPLSRWERMDVQKAILTTIPNDSAVVYLHTIAIHDSEDPHTRDIALKVPEPLAQID